MPVEFLSNEQAARYGRFPADPSPEQRACFFYLSLARMTGRSWPGGGDGPINRGFSNLLFLERL